MWTFEVWAPGAGAVSLALASGRATAGDEPFLLPMEQAGGGWWRREVPAAGPGDRYGFSLDGGPVRPDPRSLSLPDGVDGLSEIVDHSGFAWTDGAWRGWHLPGSVLYEMHIGTFSPEGTFDGAAARLGHLTDLGVDAVEILPVASFAGDRGWGYDGVGLYAPHRAYGGPEGLKRLVDACHQAGMAVVLDVVYNHLGPSGNYLSEFGPYFSEAHRTNWGDGVNLDGRGSDEVRRYFIDNALMWLADYHIDGLRLDAVHALADDSAVHFLEQLSQEVSSLSAHVRRPLTLIAESDLNDPRFVRPPREGGYGLDSAWADEWHHAWHAAFTGETNGYYEDFGSLEHLAKALRQAWVYDGVWSEHRGRTHGRRPEGLTGDRFVVCTQNHDQVGNRAAGDRSSALMSPARLKVSAGLLLTSPFIPMLFQGEEWGASTPWQYFTDFADEALGRAVTEGRRSEFSYFGWAPEDVPDPQDPATFERSKLDWSERDKGFHADLLEWHRRLLALRRELPDLTDGDLQRVSVSVDSTVQGVAMVRGSVIVAALLGPDHARLDVGEGRILAASSGEILLDGGLLSMAPESLALVEKGNAGEERHGRRTAAPPPTKLAPTLRWARDPG
ncbi:MAG TPA: malto-oligosyltrehalose trehalohydrolase [Acidimicrobiales bacterium]|nr:malto-oligosyltrehalose trehalohydrolase [Acidimicrobiales bacterium]